MSNDAANELEDCRIHWIIEVAHGAVGAIAGHYKLGEIVGADRVEGGVEIGDPQRGGGNLDHHAEFRQSRCSSFRPQSLDDADEKRPRGLEFRGDVTIGNITFR